MNPDFAQLHPELTPLPVIATYNAEGDFRPLYVQIDGNKYKVDNVKWSNEDTHSSMFFGVEFMDGEYVRSVTLVYIYSQHRWYLDAQNRQSFF